MNLAKSLLFVSIGIILTSLLIKFTEVQTNYLLIAGVVLACLSLLLPLLSSSSTASMKSTKAAKSDTVNGKVKWFNRTKGFGFITQSNGDDVFVHQTSIKSQPRFLREGQSVTMNVVEDEKGPQAENVKVA